MKYCNWYVCLFVCLHNLKTPWLNFMKFLSVAVALSSSDGIAISDVLSVLWMTSCFYVMAVWPVVYILKRRPA